MEFLKVTLFLVIAFLSSNNAKSLARLKRNRLFENENTDKFIIDMALPSLQLSIIECLYQTSSTDQLKCIKSSIFDEFNSFTSDSMKIQNEYPELYRHYFTCIFHTQKKSSKDCIVKVEEIRSEFYQNLIDEFNEDKNDFKDRLINSQLDLILWKIHISSYQQRNLSKDESRQLQNLLNAFFKS